MTDQASDDATSHAPTCDRKHHRIESCNWGSEVTAQSKDDATIEEAETQFKDAAYQGNGRTWDLGRIGLRLIDIATRRGEERDEARATKDMHKERYQEQLVRAEEAYRLLDAYRISDDVNHGGYVKLEAERDALAEENRKFERALVLISARHDDIHYEDRCGGCIARAALSGGTK